jgi:hypothetical protein
MSIYFIRHGAWLDFVDRKAFKVSEEYQTNAFDPPLADISHTVAYATV